MIPLADFYDFLDPITNVLEALIVWLHDSAAVSWGLAIVITTVIVRVVLLPLTIKQMRSMRQMQIHMPELKAIQDKYKSDRQRLQQETMKFYKENNFNPLSSCLPLLLQMPFLLAMFALLRGDGFQQDVESSGNPGWLFINSLVENPTGVEAALLIVLMIGSTVGSFLLTPTPSTGSNTQRYMMVGLFSLMFAFFVPTLPAGLSVYWITTSLWTVGQGFVMRRTMPAPPAKTPEEVRATKPPPPPPRKRKRRR